MKPQRYIITDPTTWQFIVVEVTDAGATFLDSFESKESARAKYPDAV